MPSLEEFCSLAFALFTGIWVSPLIELMAALPRCSKVSVLVVPSAMVTRISPVRGSVLYQ